MNDDGTSPAVAVACEKDGEHAEAMAAHLQSKDLTDAEWFAPRDVDDLDEAVCEGRVNRVVFVNLTGLLDAIWDEEIQFDRWRSSGTAVSFVDLPTAPVKTVGAPVEPTVAAVFESWRKWHRRHRRRQVAAGAILSGIALVAGFLLTLAMP